MKDTVAQLLLAIGGVIVLGLLVLFASEFDIRVFFQNYTDKVIPKY